MPDKLTLWARPPASGLARFFDLVACMEPAASPAVIHSFDLLPGPCAWLAFQLRDGDATSSSATAVREVVLARAFAVGLFDSATPWVVHGRGTTFLFRIRPEATSLLLGVAADALRNSRRDLRGLWGPDEDDCLDRLCCPSPVGKAMALVEEMLVKVVRSRPAPGAKVLEAVALLGRYGGSNATRLASEKLGMTTRNLNLMFHRFLGISPKRFARLARFSRAVRELLRHGRAGWRSPTLEEFYDEAHFIKDFKEHCGLTPSAFVEFAGRPCDPCVTFVPRDEFAADFGSMVVIRRTIAQGASPVAVRSYALQPHA